MALGVDVAVDHYHGQQPEQAAMHAGAIMDFEHFEREEIKQEREADLEMRRVTEEDSKEAQPVSEEHRDDSKS
ncbi:MAG: hypothetical protein M1816_003546 [Peltula sp. TS41687]|nr:MAG: hypothetical protein M1816_003546 [Peltula sp. TS41687]